MIDIKRFREDPEYYIQATLSKQEDIDFNKFIDLDKKLLNLKSRLDSINFEINKLTKEVPLVKDKEEILEKLKNLKEEQQKIKKEYDEIEKLHFNLWIKIPNPPLEDVPIGSEEDNKIIKTIGFEEDECKKNQLESFGDQKPSKNPLPHWEILQIKGLVDFERGSKVSGTRFIYIKNKLVFLELALIQYAFEKLYKKGFIPTIPPFLVKENAMFSTGFFPAEKQQIYHVNPDEDDLYLIGTSEVSLISQHIDEIFDEKDLPLRYVGFSPCFRREVGKSGKDIKGLIRLHQFEKIEMVSFTKIEDSIKEHEFLVGIEEEIYTELGIPFRKVLIASGDLGTSAAKKYDLEAFFPGMNQFKEITSCSNTTDYQARRANIKYKTGNEKKYVHTLNGTVIAIQRTIAAIIENYQTENYDIIIPKILRKYTGFDRI